MTPCTAAGSFEPDVQQTTPLPPLLSLVPAIFFSVAVVFSARPANAAGFLTSCWLSLCPHIQLPTHTELFQQRCINKAFSVPGIPPPHWGVGMEKSVTAAQHQRVPRGLLRATVLLSENTALDRTWQMLLETTGSQLLVQGSGQQKGCYIHPENNN